MKNIIIILTILIGFFSCKTTSKKLTKRKAKAKKEIEIVQKEGDKNIELNQIQVNQAQIITTPAEVEIQETKTEMLPVFSNELNSLKQADVIFSDSQYLANKGMFKEAIIKMFRVQLGDPFYAMAQEKIRDYSARGVQSLRSKAAQAFQTASQMNDREKISYLERAKKLLEEAIEKYPNSDQIEMVKKNIAVIENDMKNLTPTNQNFDATAE